MHPVTTDVLRLLAGRIPLDSILLGDPGEYAVHVRMSRRQRATRALAMSEHTVTLDDFRELQRQCCAAAELAGRGMNFVHALEQSLTRHWLFTPAKLAETQQLLGKRRQQVADACAEADRLDGLCLDAWKHYLSAQPQGQIHILKGNGKRAILSRTPLALAGDVEVWTPAILCSLLRIATSFMGPGELRDWTPEQVVAMQPDLDPVHKLPNKRPRKERLPDGHLMADTTKQTDSTAAHGFGVL